MRVTVGLRRLLLHWGSRRPALHREHAGALGLIHSNQPYSWPLPLPPPRYQLVQPDSLGHACRPERSLWQLTDKVTFASEMPYYASLGGNITRTGAASVAIQAQSLVEE